MYEAKKTGKNRVETYREGNDSVSGRRLDMEKNMRDATVEGYREFEVYYQPIIDIQGGKDVCAGAEALIRWNSAKLGFISPAEFIPAGGVSGTDQSHRQLCTDGGLQPLQALERYRISGL